MTMIDQTHRHYQVYGHRLCSGISLPELNEAEFATRDMSFRLLPERGGTALLTPDARLLSRRETTLGCDLLLYATGAGYVLRWEDFCDYAVSRDGRHIQCQLSPNSDIVWAQSTLYNMILSFALHLRGISNFHASGIQLPGGAVAFMADPGSGKSTMAATFALAGYPFLTDDVLAVQRESQGYQAFPGFPYMSLSAQSIANLMPEAERFGPLPAEGEKERVSIKRLGMSFSAGPVPLQALFLLERGDPQTALSIEPLDKAESVLGLLKHTNALPLLPLDLLQQHLKFVTDLTSVIPVYRLRYPSCYGRTAQTVAAVLRQQAQPVPRLDTGIAQRTLGVDHA